MAERLQTYIILIIGLELLFYFTGLITASDDLLATALNLENLNNSIFWSKVVLGSLATIGGIVLGIFTKDLAVALGLPVATYLGIVLLDFIKIYILLNSLNPIAAKLIFAPLFFVFGLILFEFARGKD